MVARARIPVAMTVAGSDSGGGAGIQADLKTFAALGVHGTVAITSVTAQNTQTVRSVQDLKTEVIRDQIRAVAEDIRIDAAKTGMLHTEAIVKAVSSEIAKFKLPLVVDPVMVSKAGFPLLKPEAMDALKRHLLPLATVTTPNMLEAERLAEMRIKGLKDAEKAAAKISKLGPKAVVIKGGHMETHDVVDLLYHNGEFKQYKGPRLDAKTTHGTGCSFSAAIAAELAKNASISAAVGKAKEIVTLGIKFGIDVGKGHGPVNPMATLYRESSRYDVLMDLDMAKTIIETSPSTTKLIPEVGMNIAMAVPYMENTTDVAAIEGRITKTFRGARAVGSPRFGCSSHLAKYILEMAKQDRRKTAAINLKFSEEILGILKKRGLALSFYDRREEPEELKRIEGKTIPWGMQAAIKRLGKAPDAIYHKGDVGKEPMIVVFGSKASELAKLATQIAEEVGKE